MDIPPDMLVEDAPKLNPFHVRTHTQTTITLQLDVYSIRQDTVDLAIYTNAQILANHIIELLKNEGLKIVSSACDVALKYVPTVPGQNVTRAIGDVKQIELNERDYQIVHGMSVPPDELTAN